MIGRKVNILILKVGKRRNFFGCHHQWQQQQQKFMPKMCMYEVACTPSPPLYTLTCFFTTSPLPLGKYVLYGCPLNILKVQYFGTVLIAHARIRGC